jgi:hypothetical protein
MDFLQTLRNALTQAQEEWKSVSVQTLYLDLVLNSCHGVQPLTLGRQSKVYLVLPVECVLEGDTVFRTLHAS